MRKLVLKTKAFTLIETLIVIAIIGILTSAVLPSLNYAREKAKIAKAQATVKELRNAIALLEEGTGQWPGHKTIEEVEADAANNEIWDLNSEEAGLTQDDSDNPFPNWGGPYFQEIPLDPWGNPYFFDTDYDVDLVTPGDQWGVVIGSFGPNGAGRNVYDDDNIYILLKEE